MNIRLKLTAIAQFLFANRQTGITTAIMNQVGKCPTPGIVLCEDQHQVSCIRREFPTGAWVDVLTVEQFACNPAHRQSRIRRPLFIDNFPLMNLLGEARSTIAELDRTRDQQGMDNARMRDTIAELKAQNIKLSLEVADEQKQSLLRLKKLDLAQRKLTVAERALLWVCRQGHHKHTPEVALDILRSEDGQGSPTTAITSPDTLAELLQPEDTK